LKVFIGIKGVDVAGELRGAKYLRKMISGLSDPKINGLVETMIADLNKKKLGGIADIKKINRKTSLREAYVPKILAYRLCLQRNFNLSVKQ
jgi:hypothetical protein